jgi:ribosomal protein S12 methylthiotransferase accessory factor
MIYIPWVEEEEWITVTSSTGMAGHTDLYSAILSGLYENIERDSFVLTWMQLLDAPKILITPEIKDFINDKYPNNYEFHFLDVTYDIEVPSVFGFCFGVADFGPFVAVGSATRSTYAEALIKVTTEIGQAISYFRYLLGEMQDWKPSDDFNEIMNFEEHSLFYLKRPDLWHIFDMWRHKEATQTIDFSARRITPAPEEIKRITKILKEKKYNVLVKNLTTPDVQQAGFFSVRVMVPQLLEMSGAYQFYFNGGNRLFEVPEKLGYAVRSYEQLNPYPHPFP